jgi:hypothetical protein
MEEVLWMEDIVESTPISPFLINFRVHMTSFVDSHKMVVKKMHFWSTLWHKIEVKKI